MPAQNQTRAKKNSKKRSRADFEAELVEAVLPGKD